MGAMAKAAEDSRPLRRCEGFHQRLKRSGFVAYSAGLESGFRESTRYELNPRVGIDSAGRIRLFFRSCVVLRRVLSSLRRVGETEWLSELD